VVLGDPVERQVQGVQVRKGVFVYVKLTQVILLQIKLFKRHQVCQLVYMDVVVRKIEMREVLEEGEIFLYHVTVVRASELGPDSQVRHLDPAGHVDCETVKDLRRELILGSTLHLLAENLPFLLLTVLHLIGEFHPWLLLPQLDHAVQVCDFHRQWLCCSLAGACRATSC